MDLNIEMALLLVATAPLLLLPDSGRCQQSASSSSMRWPVFFEHLGQVHSLHNRFDLALRVDINLPSLQAKVTKIVHKLRLLDSEFRDPEATTTRSSSSSTNKRRKNRTRLDELNASWREQNRHLRERCENQLRRASDLRELGEDRIYDEDPKNGVPKLKHRPRRPRLLKRRKRQGGVLKGLFGVAYAQDVEDVNRKLQSVDNKLSVSVNDVRAQADYVKSSTRERMAQQNKEIKEVEQMAEKLERKVVIMETNPFMKTSISDLVHMRNEAYKKLSLQVDLCEERLVEVESTVTALGSGKLSKFVISPAKLRQTLSAVEARLPEGYSLLFDSEDALWPYYSDLKAAADFDADLSSVLVTVRVPLVDGSAALRLHRVHNLPIKVKDGYSVIADIATEYLVTDAGKRYFLELHKEDFQDCLVYRRRSEGVGARHFYCALRPMLRADRARSCVMSLYAGAHESAWCQSVLRHGAVQPFERLNNGSWIFAALSEQIPVMLECSGEKTPTALVGFGVLSLAEGCTITSEEFWYAHTSSGLIEINTGFGGDSDILDDDDDDNDFAAYDMSKYEDDVLYSDGDNALIQSVGRGGEKGEEEGDGDGDDVATSMTSPDPTVLAATSTESGEADVGGASAAAGIKVENPVNKHATEIYKDLLIKLKDTFAQKWRIV